MPSGINDLSVRLVLLRPMHAFVTLSSPLSGSLAAIQGARQGVWMTRTHTPQGLPKLPHTRGEPREKSKTGDCSSIFLFPDSKQTRAQQSVLNLKAPQTLEYPLTFTQRKPAIASGHQHRAFSSSHPPTLENKVAFAVHHARLKPCNEHQGDTLRRDQRYSAWVAPHTSQMHRSR